MYYYDDITFGPTGPVDPSTPRSPLSPRVPRSPTFPGTPDKPYMHMRATKINGQCLPVT